MISITSKIAQSLLAFYFLHEDESLYVNEIVRRLGVDKRNLVKKLNEFEREGLFKSEIIGNHSTILLHKKIAQLQKLTEREINIISISQEEFNSKIKSNDSFITDVLKKKKIDII